MDKTFKKEFLQEFTKSLILTILGLYLIISTCSLLMLGDHISNIATTVIVISNALNLVGIIAFNSYHLAKRKV